MKIVNEKYGVEIPDVEINRQVLHKLKNSSLDELISWRNLLETLLEIKSHLSLEKQHEKGWQVEVTLDLLNAEIRTRMHEAE